MVLADVRPRQSSVVEHPQQVVVAQSTEFTSTFKFVEVEAPPLVLTFHPQPEGGFSVTSDQLPEFFTEGDTAEDLGKNIADALRTLVELYEETGRSMPVDIGRTEVSISEQYAGDV